MLDYKIKDLKRDIAPREDEINQLKQETQKMDHKLKTCNAVNSALGVTVDDLRNRQEEIGELIRKSRARIRHNDIYIQGFRNAVYWVVQYTDDHDQLKKSVHQSLYAYVKDSTVKNVEVDPDIKKEYVNQRKYLESSYHSLQKRLEKEEQIHRQDRINVMKDNIELIDEISKLKGNKQTTQQELQRLKAQHNKQDRDETDPEPQQLTQEQEQEMLAVLKREAEMKRRYISQM